MRSNGSVVWHSVYETMFFTESRDELEGSFRTFSPASESILPNNSLIIVNGKFAHPFVSDGDSKSLNFFLIESIHHSPFTMDTRLDDCDSFLPADDVPSISLLGNVVGSVIQMADGGKAVNVRVGVYIHGRNVDCFIRYDSCFVAYFSLNFVGVVFLLA